MLWFLSLVLVSATASSPSMEPAPAASILPASSVNSAHALLAADSRRIRSATPRVSRLIADGARRSRTFAELVSKIHDTNVIVYVEATFSLPADTAGRILLSGVAGNQRYLRVHVRATLQGDQMIAVIAHELRHALEIAADPSVINEDALAALYRRIGHTGSGASAYDTEAAQITGRIVRDELVG
jgi:hypothetical protein